ARLNDSVVSHEPTAYADQSTSTDEDPDGTRLIDDYPATGIAGISARQGGWTEANGQAPWNGAPDSLAGNPIVNPPYNPTPNGNEYVQHHQANPIPARSAKSDNTPLIVAIIIALIIIAIAGFTFFTQEDETNQPSNETTQVETDESNRKSTGESSANHSEDSGSAGTSTTTA
ncbi:MAG: hypothetical protein ACI4B9_01930, partial [Eggerthellaceae bacterium]